MFCFIGFWHLEYRNVEHFLVFTAVGGRGGGCEGEEGETIKEVLGES